MPFSIENLHYRLFCKLKEKLQRCRNKKDLVKRNKLNFFLQLIIFVSGSKLFSRIRDRNKNPDPCTVHVFLSKPNAAKVRSVTKIAKSSFQIWIKISRQHGLLSPLPPKKNPRKIALLPARFAKASLTWKCWQSIC